LIKNISIKKKIREKKTIKRMGIKADIKIKLYRILINKIEKNKIKIKIKYIASGKSMTILYIQ
jgi:hypothetical protein